MSDVAEIAGGLTIPQYEVMHSLTRAWASPPRCEIGDINPPQTRACRSLVDKGLCEESRAKPPHFRLTPLGLAVRQFLESPRP